MAADEAVTLLYSVIERAAHGAGATVENVRVNLRVVLTSLWPSNS